MSKATKIILWLVVAIIIIGGIWYGVSKKPTVPTTTPAPTAPTTRGPIKVGVILPLTGEVGYIGQEIQKGIELAKDEAGIAVNLIYEDEKCQGKEGVTAFQKLINVDKVDALLGPVCVTAGKSIAPFLKQTTIPVVGITPSADFAASGGKNVFTTLLINKRYAEKWASYLAKHWDTTAILYTIDEGQREGAVGIKEFFEKNPGKKVVFIEGIPPTVTDLRTIASKLMSHKFDVFSNVLMVNHTIALLKIFKEREFKVPIVGVTDPFLTARDQLEKALGKEALYGIKYVSEIPPTKTKDITERFKQKFGSEPNLLNKWGYDAGLILFEAYKNTDGKSDSVVRYIQNLNNWEGASGIISFDEDGVIRKELGIFEITPEGDKRIE
jgi:branched-chain amino acid transport system substrate-binding protein